MDALITSVKKTEEDFKKFNRKFWKKWRRYKNPNDDFCDGAT